MRRAPAGPPQGEYRSAQCEVNAIHPALRRRRARQARVHPRRPQRAAGRCRQHHRRHAHPRVGAGDPRCARARRGGDGDVASRPARPKASGRPEDSLAPIAQRLVRAARHAGAAGARLGRRRRVARGACGRDRSCCSRTAGSTRARKKNGDELAQKMAKLCDVYVNDAFGTAHRAEATTHGIAKYAPVACAGPLLAAELDALRPRARATRGGRWWRSSPARRCRPSSRSCARWRRKVDVLIVGGGIANTFILAAGGHIGKSLAEPDLVGEAQGDPRRVPGQGADPRRRGRRAKEFSATAKPELKAIENVAPDDLILDIGPDDGRRAQDDHRARRHHRVERTRRRVRVRRVRRRHEGARAKRSRLRRVLDRRRRRHAGRDREVRPRRQDRLHLDRRRRVPRIPRRQDAAGGGPALEC